MKVSELRKGMLLSPAGDNEVFLVMYPPGEKVKHAWVRTRRRFHKNVTYSNKAMYLGDRKALNMTKADSKFSNRYVLIDGEVVAVDPWSWIRIKKAVNESR